MANTSQDCDLLTSYASNLRGLYTSMSHSHTSQHLTNLPRCEFVQLAMIGGKELRCGELEEEIVRLTQQGKIETIMNHKEPLSLVDILSPPSQQTPPPPPPSPSSLSPMSNQLNQQLHPVLNVPLLPPLKHRIILIEGVPGGGKSTLAVHICYQWARGAYWLSRFDIVILAYLRDQVVQNANTLAEILPAYNLKACQCSDVAAQIIESNGVRVLFVLDGWDEFSPDLQKQSFVSTLIREPHKLYLQQSTVIITSRPVSSGNLLHIADKRVEILGFTQQQVCEYIEKALDGNSSRIQKLMRHLEEHPVIEGYCYIPLHAAFLVHIFTMKGDLPTTHHELFCDLVLCCIVRELETHKLVKIEMELSSLDDLPDNLKSQLTDLCILAHEGIMKNQILFYRKDLQAFHLPSNPPSLGLLQAVEGLTCFSRFISYNFLHLSVQELLAAYHISQLDSSKQVAVFKSMLESSRFQSVLQYYSGFTKLDNLAVQNFISSYSKQQTHFRNILPFLHCFFEAQRPSLSQLIDSRFQQEIELDFSFNPVDYMAVGYFITSLLSTSCSAELNMHLKTEHIDEHCLKLLLSEFSKYSSAGRQCTHFTLPRKLILDMTSITSIGMMLISSQLRQSPAVISELCLRGINDGKLGDNVLLHISESLHFNTHLTKLQLTEMSLTCTDENSSALTKMLEVNKTLTHLNLSWNKLSDSGARCIFQGLQHNATLVYLDLSFTGISATKDNAQALTRMLLVNNTLKHLNLSWNTAISDSGARCIFQALHVNSSLVHLELSDIGITDKGAIFIAQALNSNHSLQTLDISFNDIDDDGFAIIAKSLELNNSLRKLDFTQNYCYVTENKVKAINSARQRKGLCPISMF